MELRELTENDFSDFVKKNGKFLYIDGLDEMLLQCYHAEKMLSDSPVFKRLVRGK